MRGKDPFRLLTFSDSSNEFPPSPYSDALRAENGFGIRLPPYNGDRWSNGPSLIEVLATKLTRAGFPANPVGSYNWVSSLASRTQDPYCSELIKRAIGADEPICIPGVRVVCEGVFAVGVHLRGVKFTGV